MAATTISRSLSASSDIAGTSEIGAAFAEHNEELIWLAEFLTGDELMASACVADARAVTESSNNEDPVWKECSSLWAREATIHSVLDFQRRRLSELSWTYERAASGVRRHPPMSLDTIEFVVRHCDTFRRRLDCLCRFVLVLCGFEQRSPHEAAMLLGISKHAVEAAYNRALQVLEVIYCGVLLEACGCAAA